MSNQTTPNMAMPMFWALAALALVSVPDAVGQETPLATLTQTLPTNVANYKPATAKTVLKLVPEVEQWTADAVRYETGVTPAEVFQRVRTLCDSNRQVSQLLERTVAQRTDFVKLPAGDKRRRAIRSYLTCTAALTDLAGRMRYLSFDALADAAYDVGGDARSHEQLVDVLLEKRSGVGAAVMAGSLFDPREQEGVEPISGRVKAKILQLIRDTRQHDVLPSLAMFIRLEGLSPELTLLAAHTIRHVGLPQDERPGRDPTLQKPEITAEVLHAVVSATNTSSLEPAWGDLRSGLLDWLDQRRRQGVMEDEYRVGNIEVRAGDWLLMKNPSPYNLFTDLYPGLFTHVGVVAIEMGSDGRRRFVLIDLPETGSSIPAVTVDTYVKRTLDYVFLRHTDPKVAQRMGEVAATIIGNESRFDLNFRTEGIERLKGQDLTDKKIEGYCAGLLLLCAQESGKPRSEFFPIPEHPAGGNTLKNLAKMDVSMGQDFLSPTGSLFSPQLQIVGRRAPMYSPERQIEQAVYDHFAKQMRNSDLVPSHDWYQSLRLKLAEASKSSPALAKALADAAGVNRNMDLVAAAKLGAVVQTLDVFAYGASKSFRDARAAFRINRIRQLRERGATPAEITAVVDIRRKHADLYISWEAGVIDARQMRTGLVDLFTATGIQRLDDRFFRMPSSKKGGAGGDEAAAGP